MANDKSQETTRPITRALILDILRSASDYEDDPQQGSRSDHKSWDGVDDTVPEVGLPGSDSVTNLMRTTQWLDELCEEEQSRIDWMPEYQCLLPFKGPGSGMDTTILESIRQGHGPRPQNIEDLLAPLRLNDTRHPVDSGGANVEETYQEMLKVLQAWNSYVSGDLDDTKSGQRLREVLDDRMHLMTEIMNQKQDPKMLNRNSALLLHTLWVFRPEIMDFYNQDPSEILVLLVANIRIANPDIDDDVKENILKVLLMQVAFEFHHEEGRADERERMRHMIRSAWSRRDFAEVKRLQDEKIKCNKKRFEEGARRVIDTIKNTRKNLNQKKLEELQGLTVQQAGQKLAVADLVDISWDLVQNSCDEADIALEKACRRWSDNAGADYDAVEGHSSVIRGLQYRTLTRGWKFAAMDHEHLGSETREDIQRARMQEPGTAEMMMGIVEDTATAKMAAGRILEHMEEMEASLEEILEAASNQFREYDSLLHAMDGRTTEQAVK